MTVLNLELFYGLSGAVLAALAGLIAVDRSHPHRWGSALFWGGLAIAVGGGKWLPAAAVGYLILGLTALVACRLVGVPRFTLPTSTELEARARVLGNRLLGPVLIVPLVAVLGGLTLGELRWGEVALVNGKQVAQIALGLGCVLGVGFALRVTGERPWAVAEQGGRLLQMLGWALILPQMLAALGGIMSKAGVGEVIAQLVAVVLPVHLPWVAVVAYCAGMAGFTILLGNAFAAFPVMTLGVGLPFIVKAHGGDPAVMGALGMLSGYCGTLVTPMAANFNLVPVRLLELKSDFAVIRAQAPFAVAIWIFNVVVMFFCVYPS